MADVRCPMCGKPNPADAETCQYCQARLKPQGAASGGNPQHSDESPAAGQPSQDPHSTDWLRGLLDSSGSGDEEADSPSQPPADLPEDDENWLDRIRQRTRDEQDAVSKIGPKPNVDASQNAQEPPGDADDVASWLKSLQADDGESPPPPASQFTPGQPASQPGGSSGDGEDDEWLRSLTSRIQASQSLEEQFQGPQDASSGTPSQEPPGDAAQSGELPDWLSEISSAQPEESQAGQPPADSGELPDWLSQLQEPGNSAGEPAAEPVSGSELPDWLSDLHDQQAPAETPSVPPVEEPAAEPASGSELPDWLSDLHDQKPPAEAASELPGEPPAAAAGDLPDWLSEMQPPAAKAPSPEPSPAEPAPESTLPDWLSEMEQPAASQTSQEPSEAKKPDAFAERSSAEEALPAAEEPLAAPAEELPEWLKNLQEQEGQAETPPAQPEEAPAAEIPDWMKDAAPSDEAEPSTQPQDAEPAREIPAWMAQVEPEETRPEAETAQPAEEIPDWMAQVEAKQTQPEPEAAQPAEELPDWMKEMEEPAAPETASPPSAAEPEQVPDWMRGFQDATQSAAGEPPAAESDQPPATGEQAAEIPAEPAAEGDQPAAGEAPDWLRNFDAVSGTEVAPEAGAAAPADSVRGWLDDLDELETPAPQGLPSLESAPSDEIAPAEGMPDWLKSAKDRQPQAEAESAQPPDDRSLTDWLQEQEGSQSSGAQPDGEEQIPAQAAPLDHQEVSELLAGMGPEESASGEAAEPGEAGSLEPAQLPAWLQAMRPVESAVTETPQPVVDEQSIEKSGPLAGLRGVLPGENLAANYRKPPVYTNKLQVSEKQHLHANLLEGILADETRVQPVPAAPTQTSQAIARLAVALLLIVLLMVPSLTGLSLPVKAGLLDTQPGVMSAYQSIETLQPGAYVLVVADFEAGLNGEITSAAMPLLSHLQTRQPQILLASMVQVGPVLGQSLLTQSNNQILSNLGYIAGGANALKMLAAHASAADPAPLQQVVPFPYGGSWTDPNLKNLTDINAFQRIIVLTDNLENARGWVEQVQPSLNSQTQLLIVSSAQVAPLVRTYVMSGQVAAVVSGLAGGVAYQQLTQQSGPGGYFWTPYQLGMLAFIVLIVGGALAAGISALFQGGKSKRKD